ncbi:unnamed protein product [Amoebophrya sp. A120]|nr:unnamed protein product [Amoebophrya sp. A120]|eukprot:GSA120T00021371001.1
MPGERTFHIMYQCARAATETVEIQSEEASTTTKHVYKFPQKLSQLQDSTSGGNSGALASGMDICTSDTQAWEIDLTPFVGVDLQAMTSSNEGYSSTDLVDFEHTVFALQTIGLDQGELEDLLRCIGAVLRLGLVEFEGGADDSSFSKETKKHGDYIAEKCLGLKAEDFEAAITSQYVVTPNDQFTKRNSVQKAKETMDSFARHFYSLLFNKMVQQANSSIGYVPSVSTFIGVLDIFGFECFQDNHFEQLCINYANERLQKHFNNYVFQEEAKMYNREGVDWRSLDFPDNSASCALIEERGSGIFAVLNDECSMATGNDRSFVHKLKKNFLQEQKNAHFGEIKHKPECFIVNHYAGPVNYTSTGFVQKNKDGIPQDVWNLMATSQNKYVWNLFQPQSHDSTSGGAGSSTNVNKSATGGSNKTQLDVSRNARFGKKQATLCHIFKQQLDDLLKTLSAAEPHFIRCIKPNLEKKADKYDRKFVCEQLRYQGVLAVVEAQRAGYPIRLSHEDFWRQIRCLVTLELRKQIRVTLKQTLRDQNQLSQLLLAYIGDHYEFSGLELMKGTGSASVGAVTGKNSTGMMKNRNSGTNSSGHAITSSPGNLKKSKSQKGGEVCPYAVGKSLVFLKQNLYEQIRQLSFKVQDRGQKVIVAYRKMRKCRKHFLSMRFKVNKIQALVRGVLARKYVYGLREAQEMVRQKQKREETKRRMEQIKRSVQATKIQYLMRKFLKKLAYNRDLESELKQTAIKKLQNFWRHCLARKQFLRKLKAAVLLQAFLRTLLAKQRFKRDLQVKKVQEIMIKMRKERAIAKAHTFAHQWVAKTRLRIMEKVRQEKESVELNVSELKAQMVCEKEKLEAQIATTAELQTTLQAKEANISDLEKKLLKQQTTNTQLESKLATEQDEKQQLQKQLDFRASESKETVDQMRKTEEQLIRQLKQLNDEKQELMNELIVERALLVEKREQWEASLEKKTAQHLKDVHDLKEKHETEQLQQQHKFDQELKAKEISIEELKQTLLGSEEAVRNLEQEMERAVKQKEEETTRRLEENYMQQLEEATKNATIAQEKAEVVHLEMQVKQQEWLAEKERLLEGVRTADEKMKEKDKQLLEAQRTEKEQTLLKLQMETEKNRAVAKFQAQVENFHQMQLKLDAFQCKLLRNAVLQSLERYPEVKHLVSLERGGPDGAKGDKEESDNCHRKAGGIRAVEEDVPALEAGVEDVEENNFEYVRGTPRHAAQDQLATTEDQDGNSCPGTTNFARSPQMTMRSSVKNLLKPDAMLDVLIVGENVGKLALLERCIRDLAPDQYALFQYNRQRIEEKMQMATSGPSSTHHNVNKNRAGGKMLNNGMNSNIKQSASSSRSRVNGTKRKVIQQPIVSSSSRRRNCNFIGDHADSCYYEIAVPETNINTLVGGGTFSSSKITNSANLGFNSTSSSAAATSSPSKQQQHKAKYLRVLDCSLQELDTKMSHCQYVIAIYDFENQQSLDTALERLELAKQKKCHGLLFGNLEGFVDSNHRGEAGGHLCTSGQNNNSFSKKIRRKSCVNLFEAKSKAAALGCLSVEATSLAEAFRMLTRDFDFFHEEPVADANGVDDYAGRAAAKNGTGGSPARQYLREAASNSTSSSSSPTMPAMRPHGMGHSQVPSKSSTFSVAEDAPAAVPMTTPVSDTGPADGQLVAMPPNKPGAHPSKTSGETESRRRSFENFNSPPGRRSVPAEKDFSSSSPDLENVGFSSSLTALGVGSFRQQQQQQQTLRQYRRTWIEMEQRQFLKPSLEEYNVSPRVLDIRERKSKHLANVGADYAIKAEEETGTHPLVLLCFQPEMKTNEYGPLHSCSSFAPASRNRSGENERRDEQQRLKGLNKMNGERNRMETGKTVLAAANDQGELFIYHLPWTELERKQQKILRTSEASGQDEERSGGAGDISDGAPGGSDTEADSEAKGSVSSTEVGGRTAEINKDAMRPSLVRQWQGHTAGQLVTALCLLYQESSPASTVSQQQSLVSGRSGRKRAGQRRNNSIEQRQDPHASKTSTSFPKLQLFSASLSGEAKLWDVETGELLVCYEDKHAISCACYIEPIVNFYSNPSLSGAPVVSTATSARYLIYATTAPALRLITTKDHKVAQKLKMDAEIRCLAFDETGRFGLCGAGNGCIYVVEAWEASGIGTGGPAASSAATPTASKVNSTTSSSRAHTTNVQRSGSAAATRSISSKGNHYATSCISSPARGRTFATATSITTSKIRLRPLLSTLQYAGAKNPITSLSLQPRKSAVASSAAAGNTNGSATYASAASINATAATGGLTSANASSFATAMGGGCNMGSYNTAAFSQLCLVNALGVDAVGIIELVFKHNTLLMLNLLYTIVTPNQYLPLMSTFCCEYFAVTGTEEHTGTVVVHDLTMGSSDVHSNLCAKNEDEPSSVVAGKKSAMVLHEQNKSSSATQLCHQNNNGLSGAAAASSATRLLAYEKSSAVDNQEREHDERSPARRRTEDSVPTGHRDDARESLSCSSRSTSSSMEAKVVQRPSPQERLLSPVDDDGEIVSRANAPAEQCTDEGFTTQHANDHFSKGKEGQNYNISSRNKLLGEDEQKTTTTIVLSPACLTTAACTPVEEEPATRDELHEGAGVHDNVPDALPSKVDSYALCLAVNAMETVLAIGDTRGHISFVRRTATRRKDE